MQNNVKAVLHALLERETERTVSKETLFLTHTLESSNKTTANATTSLETIGTGMTISDTDSNNEEVPGSPEPRIKRQQTKSPTKTGGNATKRSKTSQDKQSQNTHAMNDIRTGGGVHEADDRDENAIASYLEPNVSPVTLPEKDDIQDRIGATYPPLILDGASGVGKTQQAFALLKDGGKVVYLNLASETEKQAPGMQRIYMAMTTKFGTKTFCQDIDKALEEVKSKNNRYEDRFSLEAMEEFIQVDANLGGSFNELIRLLWLRVIKYEKATDEEAVGSLRKVNDENSTPEMKIQMRELKDNVLFVDEVLPSQPEQKSRDRLEFLRNLGRAMKMRVVLAGTAATAANMWSVRKDQPNGSSTSTEQESFTWAEVEFLYRLVNQNSENENENVGTISHRPLLHRWLEDWKDERKQQRKNQRTELGYFTSKMDGKKAFSHKNILFGFRGLAYPQMRFPHLHFASSPPN